MNLQILYENRYYNRAPYDEDYCAGSCHLVGFAAKGRHYFNYYLIEAGFTNDEASLICRAINSLNRTRTVWPKANLTGIPARCLQTENTSTEYIHSRLMEVFLINREQVRCRRMVFNFKCGGDVNRKRIELVLKEICSKGSIVGRLDYVTVYLDNYEGIGTYDSKYLHTLCPLCGCRVRLSSLISHMEKRCHNRKREHKPAVARNCLQSHENGGVMQCSK